MQLQKMAKGAVVCFLAGYMTVQQGLFGGYAWGAGPGGPGVGMSGGTKDAPEGRIEVKLPFPILVVTQAGAGSVVYTAPGFGGETVTSLWPKEPVRLLGRVDQDWAKILYNGQERYLNIGSGGFEEQDVWHIPESDAGKAGMVAYAMQFLGAPYQYGGNDPATGSDCSGFVRYVMSHEGVSLPRTSAEQAASGAAVEDRQARCGDILAFGADGGINHVGIFLGVGMMLHSENSENGVTVTSLDSSGGLVVVRRVLPD